MNEFVTAVKQSEEVVLLLPLLLLVLLLFSLVCDLLNWRLTMVYSFQSWMNLEARSFLWCVV